MVGYTTLLDIHPRLKEISDTNNSQLFAGISIIALGDLHQLPPIQRKLVFDNYANNAFKETKIREFQRLKCAKKIKLSS